MKILVTTFDPPENVGGVEGRAIGYTRELALRGHHVVAVSFGGNLSTPIRPPQGVVLYRFPSRVLLFPYSFAHLLRIARSLDIDTMFFLSGATTLLGVMALLYSRTSHTRSAIFLYGKDILTAKKSPVQRVFLTLSEALTEVIATNSRYTRSLLPLFCATKTEILYPSVDENSADFPALLNTDSKKTILTVGRLVKRKGIDNLIRAFSLVIKDDSGVQLEIVGDGPERIRLERLVAGLNLPLSVTFFGELRGSALYERYRRCDIFALPSKTLPGDVEGFGTVFLEAGLFGKPSVGTLSGGIPEAIIDGVTGILVKEGDVSGLATALRRLLGDRELSRKLGDNARSRVIREFTWERGTDKLVSILERKTARQVNRDS